MIEVLASCVAFNLYFRPVTQDIGNHGSDDADFALLGRVMTQKLE